MARSWEGTLHRWVEAGLLDGATAERIRTWEAARGGVPRWPVQLVAGLGGVLLSAGVLLFVAAHWDALSPVWRFALVLATVAGLQLGGVAASGHSDATASALHACGTAALGAGIFLSGQIFNLSTHWPAGLLLWAVGAWLGWWLLREWPQALLAALTTPAWLVGEWLVAADRLHGEGVAAAGVASLALAYLAALPALDSGARGARRALAWVGGLALIPAALVLAVASHEAGRSRLATSPALAGLGWLVAAGAPLALAWRLQRRPPILLAVLVAWVAAGTVLGGARGVTPYVWGAALSLGVVGWGVAERRRERINLGVAGFAIAVLIFYFSNVMDRLGRSASLAGLGAVFLIGGWLIERARRRLLTRVSEPGR